MRVDNVAGGTSNSCQVRQLSGPTPKVAVADDGERPPKEAAALRGDSECEPGLNDEAPSPSTPLLRKQDKGERQHSESSVPRTNGKTTLHLPTVIDSKVTRRDVSAG
jgi:hypothetical protein